MCRFRIRAGAEVVGPIKCVLGGEGDRARAQSGAAPDLVPRARLMVIKWCVGLGCMPDQTLTSTHVVSGSQVYLAH